LPVRRSSKEWALEYVMCDDGVTDGISVGLIDPMAGGSSNEADLDAAYVGAIELNLTGSQPGGLPEALAALDVIRVATTASTQPSIPISFQQRLGPGDYTLRVSAGLEAIIRSEEPGDVSDATNGTLALTMSFQ
jgi:hypothetical protein